MADREVSKSSVPISTKHHRAATESWLRSNVRLKVKLIAVAKNTSVASAISITNNKRARRTFPTLFIGHPIKKIYPQIAVIPAIKIAAAK